MGNREISIRPETHKALKDLAKAKGISLAKLVSNIIDRALDIEDTKVKVSGECTINTKQH